MVARQAARATAVEYSNDDVYNGIWILYVDSLDEMLLIKCL